MIDMRYLYQHDDYQAALQRFNQWPKKWSRFKGVHLAVTNHRCPICECSLKSGELLVRNNCNPGKPQTEIKATVDHYRPLNYYPFLKFEHKNYILMCSECNNIYKGSEFPLYPEQAIRAINVAQLTTEQPLIASPVKDNIFDLFKVVTRRLKNGTRVLELTPKHASGYMHDKALETIKLFGIGDCETNGHSNENVKALRINLLRNHFSKFEKFIDAFLKKDVAKMRSEVSEKNLNSYGFLKIILANKVET